MQMKPTRNTLFVLFACLAMCVITGCMGTARKADPDLAAELSILPYPKASPVGEDLDIVAIMHWQSLELVNRTPNSRADVQLWLNQQYVARVAQLPVGQSVSVSLDKFVNQHGEEYPSGDILTPDRRVQIILAELFDPATGKRQKLLVQLPRP